MTAGGVVERGGPARWWLPTGRISCADWWLLWGLFPPIGFVVLFVTVGLLGTRPHPNRHGPPPR